MQPTGPSFVQPATDRAVPASLPRPGCGTYLLFAVTSLWVVGLTVLIHLIASFVDQVLLLQDVRIPGWVWLLIAWGHGLLLALPIVPLAVYTRVPRFRAIYRTWSVAIGWILLFAPLRLFPQTSTQAAALVQVVLGLLAVLLLRRLDRSARVRLPRSAGGILLALSIVPLVVAPWPVVGALGSPLDALLALGGGLSFGLFAGVLLDGFLVRPHARHSAGLGWDIALGGFGAALALLLLAAGFGFAGSQLLLLLVVSPLGYASVALARRAPPAPESASGALPIAALVGGAAAVVLLFVDPAELLLVLGTVELPAFAFAAAGVSSVLAWLVSITLWAVRGLTGRYRPWLAFGALIATWSGGLLLYLLVGQPGFYGDHLFVILRDQADVSAARTVPDRDTRLRSVYSTLTAHAMESQAGLRATLDNLGITYTPYYLVNGLEVNGGPLLRAYIERDPTVDRVLSIPRLRPLSQPLPVEPGAEQAPSTPPWNIRSIGAARVWRELGVTGKGIVVGQSDSGVQGDHPALREGYRGRSGQHDYHWLDPWNGTRAPTDIGGHGTHTLGSAVGRNAIGVAPDAEWFGCVNLARNIGNPARYLDCMQFLLAPYPQGGDPLQDGDPSRAAYVLNNSWGCPAIEGCDTAALQPAVAALRAAGIFVVASAGNTGPRCESVNDPPALYDESFSVGAVDEQGNVSEFSSRGPVTVDGSNRVKPDIVAPGEEILSALPGSSYGLNDGTSMAGPHVAGVVALMWSAQPRLIGDIERTEQILIETARPYTGERLGCFAGRTATNVPNDAFGYGLLDAYAAVLAAQDVR